MFLRLEQVDRASALRQREEIAFRFSELGQLPFRNG